MSNALHYRRDIDGLRALAVLAVLIFHAFPRSLKGGFIGVDIFFVISGFLITGILLRQLQAGNFSIAGFYARRIKRIFPALVVVLAAVLGFGYFALLADEYQQLGKHVAAGAGFVSNLVLWSEAGYFDVASETKPLLHLWSLGVEEQFYILWPALLYMCWRWQRSLLWILLAVTAISFAANLASLRYDLSFMFYSPLTRFWELSAGAVLALLEQRGALLRGIFARVSVRNSMAWFGLLLIVAAWFLVRKKYAFPSGWALMPVMGACLLIAAGSTAQVNRWLLSNRLMVGIGLISYPLYLWHWPLLSFARIMYSSVPPVEVRWLCVVVSFALAYATYRWIEKPIRFGAATHGKIVALCVAMAALALMGLGIYFAKGFPQRAGIMQFASNSQELVRPADTDFECLAYVGGKVLFPYCRYADVKAKHTVALIGDSHAQVTFIGMSEVLAQREHNLLMLANSACPPLLGTVTGETEKDRRECAAKMEQMLRVITADKTIRDVWLVMRGPIYTTGNGFGEAEKDYRDKPILAERAEWKTLSSEAIYMRGLQATVATMKQAGKRVFVLLENPETGLDPALCIDRPLRLGKQTCSVPLKAVMERQASYRTAVQKLSGVTLVDPLPAFCPDGTCPLVQNGTLLYFDDDHISVSGSRFLSQKVLMPYLPAH